MRHHAQLAGVASTGSGNWDIHNSCRQLPVQPHNVGRLCRVRSRPIAMPTVATGNTALSCQAGAPCQGTHLDSGKGGRHMQPEPSLQALILFSVVTAHLGDAHAAAKGFRCRHTQQHRRVTCHTLCEQQMTSMDVTAGKGVVKEALGGRRAASDPSGGAFRARPSDPW